MILGIDWNVSTEIIPGRPTPNLYGLLFVGGLILAYYVIRRMFRNEEIPDKVLDKLLIYTILATIIGARLGHVFFYDWEYYSKHPEDIIKVWEGGLASHGAALIILLTTYYFARSNKMPYIWVLDRLVIGIALAGCFIRLGNLVNHEILGIPTDLPWGFRFNNEDAEYLINGEHVYRHPTQIYEAFGYFVSFLILRAMYWKRNAGMLPGRIFGAFMILIWSVRLLVEFVKEGQTDRDEVYLLNTGQMLSIPFILIGFYFLLRKITPERRETYAVQIKYREHPEDGSAGK